MFYLAWQTRDIVAFFKNYVAAGYTTSVVNAAGTYINFFMYGLTLFIILIVLAIYLLMRQKKKKTKFYQSVLIFYVIFFVLIGITYSYLGQIDSGTMIAKTVRAIRDISNLFYYPQYFFIIYAGIRALGFDIKKFRFDKDMDELEISEEDNEEFELKLEIDQQKYKRNFRRLWREIKYYIKENKFIISIIAVILVAILGTTIYLNFGVYNKKYKQLQIMSLNGLSLQVTDSFITNVDYSGKPFAGDRHYVVIALSVENLSTVDRTLDIEKFYLEYNNVQVAPTTDRGEYFIDYGIPYLLGTKVAGQSSNNYVLAYEIDAQHVDKSFALRILESVAYQNVGDITPKYKTIKLTPEKFLNLVDEEIRLGKTLLLDQTKLDLSEFNVNYFTIEDKYTYTYKKCFASGNCLDLKDDVIPEAGANIENKALLILDASYLVDESTFYYKNIRSKKQLVNHFVSIRYTSSNGERTVVAKDMTPAEVKDKIILEIPNYVRTSPTLDILFTTRNKRYVFTLK